MLMSSLANANIAIQRLTEMMGEQRTRLNAVMATLPEGMILLDNKGQIVMENALAHILFEELASFEGEAIAYLPAEMLNQLKEEGLSCVTRQQEHTHCRFTLTLKIFHPQSPVERYALYIAKEDKSPPQPQRNLSNFMSDLIAALSHEINNPLTPILALTSPAMRFGDESDASMAAIHSSGERIADIIKQMMILETMLRNPVDEVVSLGDLGQDLLDEWNKHAPSQKVQFNCNKDMQPCRIHAAGFQQLLRFLNCSLNSQRGKSENRLDLCMAITKNGPTVTLLEADAWPENLMQTGCPEADRFTDFYRLLAETLCRQMGIELLPLQSANGMNGYLILIPDSRIAA